MAMSALVKEQIEGITPLAISLITAKKFAVSDSRAFKVYRQEGLVHHMWPTSDSQASYLTSKFLLG